MCSYEDTDGTAKATVLIENTRTRVTEWHFAKKGENTGWHVHDYDYVIVPLADGQLELHEPGGEIKHAELRKGTPYFRQRGIRHDVVNGNNFDFTFIEIELLDQAETDTNSLGL